MTVGRLMPAKKKEIQEKKEWFAWQDNGWVADMPVITDSTFACTGTRNLDADGTRAIHDLFERSFGPAA